MFGSGIWNDEDLFQQLRNLKSINYQLSIQILRLIKYMIRHILDLQYRNSAMSLEQIDAT